MSHAMPDMNGINLNELRDTLYGEIANLPISAQMAVANHLMGIILARGFTTEAGRDFAQSTALALLPETVRCYTRRQAEAGWRR